MKLRLAVAIAPLLLGIALPAQVIRGIPPSVTSIGGNRSFPFGGVPASVTSIAPTIPVGLPPSQFNRILPSQAIGRRFPGHFDGRFLGHGHFGKNRGFGGIVPVIVPYYGYPFDYAYYDEYGTYGTPVVEPGQPPVQIDIHIDDQHLRDNQGQQVRESSAPPAETGPNTSATPPAPAPEAPREFVPAVLVFRDGHRQEVKNYAIVGKVLYDFADSSSRKIQLAELDLPATVRANEERGITFTLPKGAQ